MFLRPLGFALIAMFLLAFSARGGARTVEGIVKDRTGRPIEGADVYILAKDFSKIVKTDANGHYKCEVVASGNYRVRLLVNGSIQESMRSAPANKHKHMVWVPPETGTHIGGGNWIEADDKSDVATRLAVNDVKKMDRKELTSDVILRVGGNCSCQGGGGVVSGTGLAAGRTVSPLAASRKETLGRF
jgi:protocatechuate 3,4-dioxygenase beta subunit